MQRDSELLSPPHRGAHCLLQRDSERLSPLHRGARCLLQRVSERLSPLCLVSLKFPLQVRDRWFDAIDQLIESMKEVSTDCTQSRTYMCSGVPGVVA